MNQRKIFWISLLITIAILIGIPLAICFAITCPDVMGIIVGLMVIAFVFLMTRNVVEDYYFWKVIREVKIDEEQEPKQQ